MHRENHSPPMRTPAPIQQPTGILQDAGELSVVSELSGRVSHRYAMVIAFDSEEALRRALEEHRCAYRDGQAIQEQIAHG